MLGDSAADVIAPDDFESAREAAGIRFKRLLTGGAPPQSDAFAVRVVDLSGAEEDVTWALARPQARQLLERAEHSSRRGLPLFSWDGEEIELGGETDATLGAIKRWITLEEVSAAGVKYAEVFDLGAYSDRVVGFEGNISAVPYVARKQAGEGWTSSNIEPGILVPGGPNSPARCIPLTPEQIQQLSGALVKAREQGQEHVQIPGSDVQVPCGEAEQWVKAFTQQFSDARARDREPKTAKDPPPSRERPVLQILHNIESLDYGGKPSIEPVASSVETQLPSVLRGDVTPLPHQRDGITWLQHRYQQQSTGIRGCLLADDMGLGKTMQALCLIAWAREAADERKPCLVVAPVSLLENWKSEIAKFLDGRQGPVLSLYGQALRDCRLPADQVDPSLVNIGLSKFLRPEFAKPYAIVLTTYETLRDYEFSIARVNWGIVVCDEAQKIKNPSALVTRAAKALRADFKIACTGTPVENSLADLWCLFDFFQPGLLGSLNQFTRAFRRVIETRAAGHETLVESLRNGIQPWVLRRMKDEVANLKPKVERNHPDAAPGHMQLPMSPLQQRLYVETIGSFRQALQTEDGRGAILGLLHRLRMICSNPTAVAFDDSEELPVELHLQHSPKLAWLIKQLEEIRESGEKVIIFTEFREVQRLIQRAVAQRLQLLAPIVNGSTSVDATHDASRQKIVDAFQAAPGFNVIILSTTAVGFGVNIQAANHVVHFTRPWNPAKEDQATDRAYRIGQEKTVYVYYPTVEAPNLETFDQRVDALLMEKRILSRDMLAGAQELKISDFNNL